MSTPDHVMHTYVPMWNATDEPERSRLGEQALGEDTLVTYPAVEAHGRGDLVATAGPWRLFRGDQRHRAPSLPGARHFHRSGDSLTTVSRCSKDRHYASSLRPGVRKPLRCRVDDFQVHGHSIMRLSESRFN